MKKIPPASFTTLSKTTDNLPNLLKEIKNLLLWCEKSKTIEPLRRLPQPLQKELADTCFLLSEEWSRLFLSLLLHKQIEDFITLEDYITNSAHRGVLESLKNLLNQSLKDYSHSNLYLYKLRRIYYTLSTYFNEDEIVMSYEISLYHPPLCHGWVHSLEDLT